MNYFVQHTEQPNSSNSDEQNFTVLPYFLEYYIFVTKKLKKSYDRTFT